MVARDRVDILRRAKRLERAGRWAEARDAWQAAAGPGVASAGPARRTDLAGLTPGTVLEHRQGTRHGHVVATCTYAGPGQFVYAGATYSTPTGAAIAASRDLGLRVRRSGWVFWRIEPREEPRVTELADAA